MPLSEQEFNALVERVIATAPPGLTEDQLDALIDQEAAKPEAKSLGGFAENVVESGGRFFGNVANAFAHPIETAKGIGAAVAHPIDTAQAIGSGLKERYGSLDAIGNTLYEDPVGVAADLSSVLLPSGGALRAGGALLNAPKVARAGRLLTRASDLTNPTRALTAPVRKVAQEFGIGAVRSTVRPSKANRDDFGGSRAISKTIIDEGITTEKGASRRLGASRKAADDLLAKREAAGVPGVPRARLVAAVQQKPSRTASVDADLGLPNAPQAVQDRATNLRAAGRGDIPLTRAQEMKRRAQDLAFEAGKQNLSLDKQMHEAQAHALRTGIERRVPDVAPINERSQRLIGAQRALHEAEDRPRALTNFLASGFGLGVGAGTANPLVGIGTAAAIRALDSPRVGTMTGIAADRFGRGLDAEALYRAAILAQLQQEATE